MSNNKIRLVPISANELLKQQMHSITESIRYRQSGGTSGNLYPPQFGGIFTQREILSGGHVMRLTKLPGGSK